MNKRTIFGQKCIVYDKNSKKFLILQRSNYKKDGGMWDMIGGSVDWGEDSKKAIIREGKEECELIIKNPKIIDLHSAEYENGNVFFIFGLYFCDNFEYVNGEIKLSKEHNQYRWISINDFDKFEFRDTTNKVKEIIIEYVSDLE